MKTIVALMTLMVLTLPSVAQLETKPSDKDIPLAEAVRQANELWPDIKPLTEQEVVAAVKAIKVLNPDINDSAYQTYMRIVREKVLPKGMIFRRITSWTTKDGQYVVDWLDLCYCGRVATEQERNEFLSKLPANVKATEYWVGGFEYRLRSQFISE